MAADFVSGALHMGLENHVGHLTQEFESSGHGGLPIIFKLTLMAEESRRSDRCHRIPLSNK
jgi:hypothetical protein